MKNKEEEREKESVDRGNREPKQTRLEYEWGDTLKKSWRVFSRGYVCLVQTVSRGIMHVL